MDIVLHIGRHKSGTSSLQAFLKRNPELLDAQGVLYPKAGTGGGIAHHRLAGACNKRKGDREEAMRIARAMRDEIKPHHKKIIISSEAFQNVKDTSILLDVTEVVSPRANVFVVCYVREHVDYAVSSLKQLIQNQQRFVTLSEHVSMFRDPSAFLSRWRSIGDLSLRWYHRSLLKDGDIIADFLDQVGLEAAVVPSGDMNPSIGGNLLICKMAMNRLGLQGLSYGHSRKLAADERRNRQEFFIDDEAVARVRAASRYNAVLFKELGEPPLRSWAGYQTFPDLETLEEDIARILSGLPLDRGAVAKEAAASENWLTV